MLLSDIFKEYKIRDSVKISNEKDFEYLGLTASEVQFSLCVFLDDLKHINSIKKNIKMIITNKDIGKLLENENDFGLCIVENPRKTFFEVHNYLSEKYIKFSKNKETTIGKGCAISNLASISKNNITIGDNVIIEEFVVIRENTVIGDDCIIRAGSVIGGQGYEFKRVENGILSVFHSGGVFIGKNVEIQYNTCIDRAVYQWDNTVIQDNCKIDNLVHIAHGVKIDKNTMIVANSGIGGRTQIGKDAWIGFGATIINGVTIGDGSRANMGSVVTKSIPEGCSYTGNFAIEHSKFIKNLKKIQNDD